MLNFEEPLAKALEFSKMKIHSLSIPISILAKGIDKPYTTQNFRHEEVKITKDTPFLLSNTHKYSELWNIVHEKGWFEGDGVPGVKMEPLPQLNDWYSKNHLACQTLYNERENFKKYLRYWFDKIKLDDGTASVKHKEANVGYPFFEKEVRSNLVDTLFNSANEVNQMLSLSSPLTVTGYRTQDEKIGKERKTIIKGKEVIINKLPSKDKYILQNFDNGCSMRNRPIAVLPALNIYLMVFATLLHKAMLKTPIFHYDPVLTPTDDCSSIDFSAQDTCHCSVYFQLFYEVMLEYGWKQSAEVFKYVYNAPVMIVTDAEKKEYYIEEGKTCAFSSFKHWGLPTGVALTSAFNKIVHTYNLYVRVFGLDKALDIFNRPEGRLNNADDNFLKNNEIDKQIESAIQLGFSATIEERNQFNGFVIDTRNGQKAWCSRLNTFFRRFKPEHSAGGKWNKEPWLGFFVGRAFHYQHLPTSEQHYVLEEMSLLSDFFGFDFYHEASKLCRWAIDTPVSYIDYLRLTKPDAVFWLEDIEEGPIAYSALLRFLR